MGCWLCSCTRTLVLSPLQSSTDPEVSLVKSRTSAKAGWGHAHCQTRHLQPRAGAKLLRAGTGRSWTPSPQQDPAEAPLPITQTLALMNAKLATRFVRKTRILDAPHVTAGRKMAEVRLKRAYTLENVVFRMQLVLSQES